ncbi:MAG: heavy metal-binding domain-containing protein [Rectinemataceae bacterium]
MKYKCSMGCEGAKTYSEPGKCPVCGMKLVLVEETTAQGADDHTKEHDHSGHSHKHCC